MTRHHSSIVGGSTADRLLSCPGSYQAQLALPPSADTSSTYAAEGTFYHTVMEIIMAVRKRDKKGFSASHYAFQLIGTRFYDRELTREHVETVVSPALAMLDAIEDSYGGGFKVLAIEKRVAFPGVPGAFGTIDLILESATCLLHLDWKFGQGVGIGVIYRDDDGGERVNAQLMYYLAGAMATMPRTYKNKAKALALAIVQPRNPPARDHVAVSREEVNWFVEDMQAAVVKALDRDPIRQKGEHCRFAPCKIDCPLWTGPVLDLTALGAPAAPAKIPDDAYGAYLARAKTLADIAAQFKKEVDEQLHSYLENGGTVPGWRLKLKSKMRQWVDEDTVEQALRDLGFELGEIWQSKLQTFQSVDATAKKLGVKIPDTLRVAPETHETTIATTDDPAPVVERQLAIEQFRASLKALRG